MNNFMNEFEITALVVVIKIVLESFENHKLPNTNEINQMRYIGLGSICYSWGIS